MVVTASRVGPSAYTSARTCDADASRSADGDPDAERVLADGAAVPQRVQCGPCVGGHAEFEGLLAQRPPGVGVGRPRSARTRGMSDPVRYRPDPGAARRRGLSVV